MRRAGNAMNRSIPWIAIVTAVPALAAAPSPDPAEEADIAKKIASACPGQQALAEVASRDFHDSARLPVAAGEYRQLASCAKNVSIVFIRIGFAEFAAGDFAASERDYRRAVAIEPNYTNKLSLLEALVREKKPEADALYAELSRYDGDRDDIWAALAYVAFHRDDVALMKQA